MSFGYLGDTSTKIKQQVKNQGVISIAESYELEKLGHLGGSLELIQSQTASSSSSLDFTNLGNFDVHLFTGRNINMSANNQFFRARLSNDGGSSYENSNYDQAGMRMLASTTPYETQSTTDTFFGHTLTDNSGGYSSSADNGNFYMYCYNLLNSSKYSYSTSHSIGLEQSSSTVSTMFGGGVYHVAETVNAVRFLNASSGTFSGVIKLYGVKQ